MLCAAAYVELQVYANRWIQQLSQLACAAKALQDYQHTNTAAEQATLQVRFAARLHKAAMVLNRIGCAAVGNCLSTSSQGMLSFEWWR